MKTHYLEIVTHDVDGVCAAYAAALGAVFAAPEPLLGGARTAVLADGGLPGVRAPLRDSEAPVVRPYWRGPDIDVAVAELARAGAQVAMPATGIPGRGRFALCVQGGNDHGLWQP